MPGRTGNGYILYSYQKLTQTRGWHMPCDGCCLGRALSGCPPKQSEGSIMSSSRTISGQSISTLGISRRRLLAGAAMAGASLAATLPGVGPAFAEDTIKVGILHSLSGTMAISETT